MQAEMIEDVGAAAVTKKPSRSRLIREYLEKHGMNVPAHDVAEALGNDITDSHVNVMKSKIRTEKEEGYQQQPMTATKRIKVYLKAHGVKTPTSKVVEDLRDVSSSSVNYVKSVLRKRRDERRGNVVVRKETDKVSLETILKVRDFIKELGGVNNLLKCLEIFKQ